MPTREQIAALIVGLRVSQLQLLCNWEVNSSAALSSRAAALKYALRLADAWRIVRDTFRDGEGHLQRGRSLTMACCDRLVDCGEEDTERMQVFAFCHSQLSVLSELLRVNVFAGVVPELQLGGWLNLGLELPRGEIPPPPFIPPRSNFSIRPSAMARPEEQVWRWNDEQRVGNLLRQVDIAREDILGHWTGQEDPNSPPYDDSEPRGWGMFEAWLDQYEELVRQFPFGYEDALIRERDYWIYKALRDPNRSLAKIIADLQDEAERHTPNWAHFSAPGHLVERGEIYARAFDLDPPPPRQRGRPRGARNPR